MQLRRFAVIGHPIGHTMSPFIHDRLFSLTGHKPEYSVLDVPSLTQALPALRTLDGFNITIPHKSDIIPLLDGIDEKAKLFGSVNTVRVEDGKMTGYTTDGVGCKKALARYGLDFNGKLLLLGRGGAARAIAFEAVLTADAPHLDIVCRESSLEKAQVLSDELAELCRTRSKTGVFRVLSYDELAKETGHYDLVLNTTSLGMYPKTGVSAVGEDVLSRCKAAFDAVYNPGKTKFLKLAASCGLKTVGGMGMLVCQAVAAHELWYGASFKDSDIEQDIRSLLDKWQKTLQNIRKNPAPAQLMSEMNRAKLQFVTCGMADRYEAIQMTILNRNDGQVDALRLRFADLWGKGQTDNPYIRRSGPYAWTDNGQTDWYAYRPTAADYETLTNAVSSYLEVFQEQTAAQQWQQTM